MIVKEIKLLIEKYNSLKSKGLIKTYDEANTCKDFILPLFQALGWDVLNREEVTAQASASRGRVDYAFCIKGIPKFFLEAKSLKSDLNDPKWAEQTINYAWHKGVVWAVLTDFEAIKVFNAEWISKNPSESLFFEIRYDRYLDNYDQLSLLSKRSFLENKLDKEAEKWGKKRRKISVDEKLLSDILKWRNLLATNLRQNHPALHEEELDESIQRILDRLIFIRTCEDRNIEPITLAPLLREWLAKKENVGQGLGKNVGQGFSLAKRLKSVFRNFDEGYNSQIFSSHFCEDLKINEDVLETIINGLYETEDRSIRYDFSAIDADVLGSMYEQYLGHILKKTPTRTTVREKHIHRKEMGIYYTPKYIVDYIVKNTVGEVLKEKSYKDAMKLKILDPACGSGSFLIRAFEEMDNYLKEKRSQKGEEIAYFRRMEILNNNLYGVDLDKQAVEIAQLNLLLKALETRQKLPIIKNIRQGNSLISGDELTMFKYFGKEWKQKHPFNWQEEYVDVFKDGGFDVVIGNPPYERTLVVQDKGFYQAHYKSAYGSYDIYVLFIERAIKLLKDGGLLGFITSNKYLVSDYAKPLRELLFNQGEVVQIIDLADAKRVFKEALVSPAIIIYQKKRPRKAYSIEKLVINDTKLDYLIGEKQIKNKIPISEVVTSDFRIDMHTDPQSRLIMNNVYSSSKHFKDLFDIRTGIMGFDYWKLENFISDQRTTKNSCHIATNSYIEPYRFLWGKKVKIYKDKEFSNPYLNLNNDVINESTKKLFLTPKIIVRGVARKLTGSLDEKGEVGLLVAVHCIVNKTQYDNRFILGLINSSLFNWIHLKKFYGARIPEGSLRYPVSFLKQLPIRKIDFTKPKEKKLHDDLVKLVEKMLELNKDIQKVPEKSDKWHSLQSEISKTDKMIDELVYKLYNITKQEKAVIENS